MFGKKIGLWLPLLGVLFHHLEGRAPGITMLTRTHVGDDVFCGVHTITGTL